MSAQPDSLTADSRFLNRQLSWHEFNRRVLALAEDQSLPFADRMRFVSIWAANLDEYFLVRVASMKDDARNGRIRIVDDGVTSTSQFQGALAMARAQHKEAQQITQDLCKAMARDSQPLMLVDWTDLSADEQGELSDFYLDQVFPILTPLAVYPGHPFPYISTLSLNLGMLIADPTSGIRRFARVKVPTDLLGRHVYLGAKAVPLEQIIAANLDQLMPGVDIIERTVFRVTRNADISVNADTLDDHDDDLLTAVESELRRRRFGEVVRVEIDKAASSELRTILVSELDVEDDVFFDVDGLVDLASYANIDKLVTGRDGFTLTPFSPRTPHEFANIDSPDELFARIRKNDILVHHPYESFDDSVLAFINAAADDPHTQAIKMTMYRMSGDGLIVEALVRAAEAGKQVVVVVELKARFDEAANISWARRLERAGVHVAYGFVSLKIHTKTCLVIRREEEKLSRYCHFGTGNYNARTARLYTDIGLFTCNKDFGADLSALFNSLTGFHVPVEYNHLVVAPADMRPRLTELIRNEAALGADGHIRMKMNSLVDPGIIDELYAASQQGVRVELIIRGMCCLRPGVPGMSENISVRSILGRYLEHARAYWFANGEGIGNPHYLIGSADMMSRNLDRRVEALVPVGDPMTRTKLDHIIETNLADNRRSWTLNADGSWTAPDPSGTIEMHVLLHEQGV
ncbi:UNVERIFIED_CONTAM: hypothetical protein GTU68_063318 [Idotea baltica]|nr:hypothetical protein [Idotea baltica]